MRSNLNPGEYWDGRGSRTAGRKLRLTATVGMATRQRDPLPSYCYGNQPEPSDRSLRHTFHLRQAAAPMLPSRDRAGGGARLR